MSSDLWRKGKVVEVTGPLTYVVQGKGEWRKHIDQMRLSGESRDSVLKGQGTGLSRWPTQNVTPYTKIYPNQESNNDPDELASDHPGSARHQPFADGGDNTLGNGNDPVVPQASSASSATLSPDAISVRRSSRTKKAPVGLNL